MFPVNQDILLQQNYWVKNPFLIKKNKPKEITVIQYEKCIEMTTDFSLKTLFD